MCSAWHEPGSTMQGGETVLFEKDIVALKRVPASRQ
jgi:hypothetical protein